MFFSPSPSCNYQQLPLTTQDLLKPASVVGWRGHLARGCWNLWGLIMRWYGLRKWTQPLASERPACTSHLLMGVWNNAATVEKFGSSTKSETQNYHMTWNSTPPYRLKKNENRCSDRNMYMNVHSTTIEIAKSYNKPTGHLSNEEWITNVVCPYNGLLFGCIKNRIPIDATVWINFAKWRSWTQKSQHCMTSFIGNIQKRQDAYRQKAD